jgi:PleD family two-component response regulator
MTADGSSDWSDLVEMADKRMYKAKKSGRDRVVTIGEAMVTARAPNETTSP